MNYIDVILDSVNAIDPLLALAPLDRNLGEGDVETSNGRLRLRIGERPIARNLRSLYEQSGKPLPPDFQVFMAYDIWMITHVISVVREGGFKKVRQLGCQVEFDKDAPFTTLALLCPCPFG